MIVFFDYLELLLSLVRLFRKFVVSVVRFSCEEIRVLLNMFLGCRLLELSVWRMFFIVLSMLLDLN